MFLFLSLFVATNLIGCTLALPPPSYLKVCDPKDGNFKQCLVDSANSAFKDLKNGDKKYRILSVNPLKVSGITIKQTALEIHLINTTVYGLENTVFTGIDFTEDHLTINYKIPKLEIVGPYKGSGKILFLELGGQGHSNITAVNGNYTITNAFKTIERNGEKYLEMSDAKLNFKLERAYFAFENLFKDNDLGIDVNQILNDSWEPVLEELGSGLENAVIEVYKQIVVNLFYKVPKKYFLFE